MLRGTRQVPYVVLANCGGSFSILNNKLIHICHCYFAVEITIFKERAGSGDSGISWIKASIDFYDPQVHTLQFNINYPDDIKEEYWKDLIGSKK